MASRAASKKPEQVTSRILESGREALPQGRGFLLPELRRKGCGFNPSAGGEPCQIDKKSRGEVETESGEMLKGPKPLQEGQASTKKQTEGGAGNQEVSELEPEKQGGIGGP